MVTPEEAVLQENQVEEPNLDLMGFWDLEILLEMEIQTLRRERDDFQRLVLDRRRIDLCKVIKSDEGLGDNG